PAQFKVIPPTIIRVKPAATVSDPDGLSWSTAYGNIYAAISNAPAGGVEIWIAKGTYSGASQLPMRQNLALFGGFEGNETSRTQRVVSPATATIVEGSIIPPTGLDVLGTQVA